MSRRALAVLAVLAALASPGATLPEPWLSADPDYAWSFPRDHFSHPGHRVEWWYFTGHLRATGTPGPDFGYQFTLFRVGVAPAPPRLDSAWATANLLMGHASLTDKAGGTHRFSEVLYRETPLLAGFAAYPGAPLAWSRGPVGTEAPWTLAWNGEGFDLAMADLDRGFAFALSTRPLKPLVLQGPNGYSRKSSEPGAASLYYSFTRMRTAGRLTVDGQSWEVEGETWMDREFSTSQLSERQVGWDWFGLQLDDGRELMLYRLRDKDGGTDFARGTVISARGEPRYLGQAEWSSAPAGEWRSPATGHAYPSGWRVEVASERLSLVVSPAVAGQENVARLAGGLSYWEGAVEVRDATGAPAGRGYVELTGYGGAGNRPPV